ncbi:FERM M domain containing protein [Trichuris trichiura]|uniref:FERM domain-containing protein 8 n=1 Tax=Trichuris trichiura TaxID=36087 RepID=A0A077ZD79_TRITR|nr:FERM M domain containing protein [Trichuris trichiura]
MLYLDAKDYTLSGYRPLPVDHCVRLAAIQMAIEWGPLNSNIHTLHLIRDAIEDFFPEHVLPSVRGWSLFGWTISGCAGVEAAIMEQYEEMSALSKNELQKRYLQLSRQHPGYGSAVFFGLIELHCRWWRTRHVPAIVTINSCWLCIINETSRIPLLTINIAAMKWCSLEGSQNNDPLLVLLFPADDRTQLNNMIAIASKQAPLMEALLDSVATAQEGQCGSFRHLDETFENFFENRTDTVVSALFDIRKNVCLDMPESIRSRWLQNVDYSREPNDSSMEHCLA